MTRGPIDAYLDDLDAELRLNRAPRRRLLEEVEDHLRSSATEVGAEADIEEGERTAVEGERTAVERFGAAATIARSFALAVAARSARRSALWLGLAFATYAAACVAFALAAPPQFADFPQGAPSALALQVAAVAFVLSAVRSVRWRGSARTPEDRIGFLANGAVIGAVALAAGIAGESAIALTRPAGVLPWQDLPLVTVLFGFAAAAALAAGLSAAAATFRASTVAAAPGARSEEPRPLPTLVDDAAGLASWARRPLTAGFRRPALLAAAVAGAALVAVFVSQVVGRPATQHASILLPALAVAALEALCVLGGYLALGRSLGLRGDRRPA